MPPKINNGYSDQLKQLIYSCLSENPWERPTASELKTAGHYKSYNIKKKRQHNKIGVKTFYKLCLSIIAVTVIAALSWIKINDVLKRIEHERLVAASNSAALEVMHNADSIVSRQKSLLDNPRLIDNINEDSLEFVVKIYDDALKMNNCSDSVYNVIKFHKEVAFKDLIQPIYTHFKDNETVYNNIGAYSAAEQFRKRRMRVESLINKDNINK